MFTPKAMKRGSMLGHVGRGIAMAISMLSVGE